jgi:acyl transferase domain-containing protein
MLKAVLAAQKVLPPTIKVDRPNPALGLEDSPFYLNTATRPWGAVGGRDAHPRRVGVQLRVRRHQLSYVALEEYW